MPSSLERLDLLFLTVAKTRRVQQDGIHFQNHRYMDITLASFVKEEVLIRYDPADMGEVHVFYQVVTKEVVETARQNLIIGPN